MLITGSSEFETNNFQQPEYTIDLSHFQFSEPNGLSFDDIMPGGSLIVIQAEDQEANKENVGGVQEDRHSPVSRFYIWLLYMFNTTLK